MDREIEKLYYDPSFPASFSGLKKFYAEARKVIPGLKYKRLLEWSKGVAPYTMHRPARKRFKRQRIYTQGIDYLWEVDLVDVSRLKEYNDGMTFLLVCIDTFSKYAWVRALKNKSGRVVTEAFDDIKNESKRKPKELRYDQGSEFKNRIFQALLQRMNIHGYEAINDTKAAIVERFNRTLKNKMYRAFTSRNELRYIDILQELIDSYNDTYHRSIGIRPSEVNAENEAAIRTKLFPEDMEGKRVRPKFKVGDYVRISKNKRMFEKEHAPNWTEEIFKIQKVLNTNPRTYLVSDLLDEEITGRIYEKQLQRVALPETYVVERVHKRRTRKGRREVLVSWRGYPEKFQQWIPAEDLVEL